MLTETLTFHEPAEQMPDSDLTVIVRTRGCEEPVWLGYHDGEQWRDVDNLPIDVVRWAELPAGGDE